VSKFAAWWLALRPATLVASISPVMLGCALALRDDVFVGLPALLALGAAVFVQIGTNLANDVLDFKKGADTEQRLGPPRATAQGWLTPTEVSVGAAIALLCSGACGLGLAFVGGWPVVVIALVSLLCALAYTGGPLPLAYVGLGDVFVFVFFGLIAVAGTVYVQALQWPVAAWWLGAIYGCLATAILVVNNLRDRFTDEMANKRTLAVRFGPRFTRLQYALLLVVPYVLSGGLGWFWPLGTAPLALLQIRAIWNSDGAELNPHLGGTARLGFLFSLVLSLQLVLA
jgi:1,4-dihydroxy-2-naphthoate octaprenyltransferase